MGRKRQMQIGFPLGGLDRKAAYRQQKPYTTVDCLNVRPTGTIERRDRGGTRPGLVQSHQDDIGSNPRLASPMIIAPGDSFTTATDTFGGTVLGDHWTTAATYARPSILSQMASLTYGVSEALVYRDTLPIDTSSAYTVEALLVPWDGEFHGKYNLYVRLDDTTPAWQTDGIKIELTMTGSGGVYTGEATSYVGGVLDATAGLTAGKKTMTGGTLTGSVARPVWLIVQVTADTVVVTLDGTTIMTQAFDGAQNGVGVGFGMDCTEASGLNLINVLRVQYYSTGTVPALRSLLVASAGGNLWREGRFGRMSQLSTNLSLRSDVSLEAAQSGQKLYIADYGDTKADADDGVISGATLDSATYADWTAIGLNTYDFVVVLTNGTGSVTNGTYEIQSIAAGAVTLTASPGDGNCSFRIERGPKVFDPIADTLTLHIGESVTTGPPTGCPHVSNYLDRLFWSGAEIAPHAWFAARKSNEDNHDYGQTDSTRAILGTSSEAGVPGYAIKAQAPYSDDYMVLFCQNEIWRMRGDPAYGGSLDNVSRKVGCLSGTSWTFGPEGELIFLSQDGLYILPPGAAGKVIQMSRDVLPAEFLNLDPNNSVVILEYDSEDRGVHIFIVEDSDNTRTHWWFDWPSKSFWPVQCDSDHEPTAMCLLQATAIEEIGVILAGRDGKLRRFSRSAENDSGTAFTTYVDIGPMPLAADAREGTLVSIDAVMAEDGESVTWALYPGKSFEEAANSSTTNFTGTWAAGINGTVHPGGRGQAWKLRITGTSGRRWAVENIIAFIRSSGPRRIF